MCEAFFLEVWTHAETFADAETTPGDIVTVDHGTIAIKKPKMANGCTEWVMAPGCTVNSTEATAGSKRWIDDQDMADLWEKLRAWAAEMGYSLSDVPSMTTMLRVWHENGAKSCSLNQLEPRASVQTARN